LHRLSYLYISCLFYLFHCSFSYFFISFWCCLFVYIRLFLSIFSYVSSFGSVLFHSFYFLSLFLTLLYFSFPQFSACLCFKCHFLFTFYVFIFVSFFLRILLRTCTCSFCVQRHTLSSPSSDVAMTTPCRSSLMNRGRSATCYCVKQLVTPTVFVGIQFYRHNIRCFLIKIMYAFLVASMCPAYFSVY
jgi:hypothetical protein